MPDGDDADCGTLRTGSGSTATGAEKRGDHQIAFIPWLNLNVQSRTSVPLETSSAVEDYYYETSTEISTPAFDKLRFSGWGDGGDGVRVGSLDRSSLRWSTSARQLSLSWLYSMPRNQTPGVSTIPLHGSETGELEIGVFHRDGLQELGHISVAGYLFTKGKRGSEHTISPTLFSFPSRHMLRQSIPEPLEEAANTDSFSAQILEPHGLHPKIRLDFDPLAVASPLASCRLFSYWTLPSAIFVDQYQLAEPLLLKISGLKSIHTLAGAVDLEAPDWAIEQWGSVLLLELDPRGPAEGGGEGESFSSELPTHSRYMPPKPAAEGASSNIAVPYPAVFWACDAEAKVKTGRNPWDSKSPGYVGLLGEDKVFYHLVPRPAADGSLYLDVSIPVLDSDWARTIEVGTALTVLLGFLWICWKLFLVGRQDYGAKRRENAKVAQGRERKEQ